MENINQLKQSAITRINLLPPSKLPAVIDFIDFLLERSNVVVSQKPDPPQGSIEDLLACAGTWKFEPGELEELLEDIEQSRLMELEEAYDQLLT